MSNDRIYYAIQQVSFIRPDNFDYRPGFGLQSIELNNNINFEAQFECNILYDLIESNFDSSFTATKLIDGNIPIYLLATAGQSNGPDIVNRCTSNCNIQLGIWSEDDDGVSGMPKKFVDLSGCFINSINYNFPIEGNFTEEVSFVNNTQKWNEFCPPQEFIDGGEAASIFFNIIDGGESNSQYTGQPLTGGTAYNELCDDSNSGITGFIDFINSANNNVAQRRIARRQDFLFPREVFETNDPDFSVLPNEIFGVVSGVKTDGCKLQSIDLSVTLNREEVFEFGKTFAYDRLITFPIEVTSNFTIIDISGEVLNFIESSDICSTIDFVDNQKIRFSTCDGLRIYLGDKNKLTSISYQGPGIDGSNATITYTYRTFNFFNVVHINDDFADDNWWDDRDEYLGSDSLECISYRFDPCVIRFQIEPRVPYVPVGARGEPVPYLPLGVF
jgi:hypothetical protein